MEEIILTATEEPIAPKDAKIVELDGKDLFVAIRDYLQKYRGVIYANEKTTLEISWQTSFGIEEISPKKRITATARIFKK